MELRQKDKGSGPSRRKGVSIPKAMGYGSLFRETPSRKGYVAGDGFLDDFLSSAVPPGDCVVLQQRVSSIPAQVPIPCSNSS